MGSLAPSDTRTLLVLGSGPGIGRSVTTLFASRWYGNVVLIARRADQLKVEKEVVERIPGVKVGTYAVDLTDTDALVAALDDADATFGKPEVVFYNAARVRPSAFFEHPVEDIEYDLKINVSALYNIASRYLPYLSTLPKTNPSSHPALIVTSSALPHHPIPQFFALSLVKAAQRNLVQSLHLTYAPQGVHVGVINVGGPVSPDHEAWNPSNIAEKTWGWFEQAKPGNGKKESFEVLI
ncbi:hypothetical protein B0T16DRAFT_503057 [Cercophora newfieldiana]|uniref:Short-chain alcohol dehydrogenase n=1 Tax=Cercophora newfieldiana TaxID=92897 RepID=A0AA39YSZ5_9PEZI|nr:hypothetical protein B0T16DRAFT_503057 [Cercophora newfieldiana]